MRPGLCFIRNPMRRIIRHTLSLPDRVRVHSTRDGFTVQVYGQTVLRTGTHREALRKADELRRALS